MSRQIGHSPLSESLRLASTPSAKTLLPLPSDAAFSDVNCLMIESISTPPLPDGELDFSSE